MNDPNLTKTKQHFEILDGLRGVAALAVVIFHFLEVAFPDPSQNLFAHSFLAVDFFFCLSGFVIAYAYDDRIEKMGITEFFKSRLIRLHPLVIVGSILGLAGYFLMPNGGIGERSIFEILLIFICSLLLIPLPIMKERYNNNFGLNAPAWSLFWEYIANIVYSLILWRVSRKTMVSLNVVAAIILIYVAYQAKNILGGWDGLTFWHGGARVFYSFSAGILVYRYKLIIPSKLGFIGLALLLVPAFLYPFNPETNYITEPLIVILYFPFLVALGAGTIASSVTKKICNFSGNLSYPLYMTHYFAIWIFAVYQANYKCSGFELFAVVSLSTAVLIGIAYLTMRYIDIPIRHYLTQKRK
ncbi:acyltransferase family protein [Flavobacterium denitrificans]|uniref:acyltransferase family protein n=1 Tax=Flavobacterium denitrificans TaxID=281361 RepID=UPI000421550B|nr:acyltransferase [Flavobacterium denitrificans]